jgi:hypothetical protein
MISPRIYWEPITIEGILGVTMYDVRLVEVCLLLRHSVIHTQRVVCYRVVWLI